MDIILGAMNFKLNNMNKEKLPNSNKRGKRTIAKEKLYKKILENIKDIHPNFNVGFVPKQNCLGTFFKYIKI